MKKLILTAASIVGLSTVGFSQSILFGDYSGNATDLTINGVADHTQDVNLELLYSTTSTTTLDPTSGLNILNGSPVVTLLLSSSAAPTTSTIGGTYSAAGDISSLGTVLDNSGQAYQFPSATTYSLQVLGWTGSFSSLDAAVAAGQSVGATSIFSVTPAGGTAPPVDVSGMGVLNLAPVAVPEPTTLAMAGVGLASMLIFRRKK